MMNRRAIFSYCNKSIRRLGAGMAILAMVATVAMAADDGCDTPGNDYVVPMLALCSTHAYNIGWTTNPNNSADRQAMNQVIAMKTTVIAQQMKRQYDYLDATIRRFETQLERAILTQKLETAAAIATGDTAGGGSSGGNKSANYNKLVGADNCGTMGSTDEVFECLLKNYNLINSSSNGGENITIELRKQLANDCQIANDSKHKSLKNDQDLNLAKYGDKHNIDCTKAVSGKADFRVCLNGLINVIRRHGDAEKESSRQPANRNS